MLRRLGTLTSEENLFDQRKLEDAGETKPMTALRRNAALVAYRAASDLAGKGAFFVVTIVAARRLSQDGFGLFSLGTTVGWIAAVVTDFGIQLHLARAVARSPVDAEHLLRAWLRVRLWTSALTAGVVAAGLLISGSPAPFGAAIFLFTLVYIVSGLVEFLHYFYRGLARSDLESALTLCQRAGTLLVALAVLWWRPGVTTLAAALLLPAAGTLAYSLHRAHVLAATAAADSRVRRESQGSPLSAGSLRDVLPIGAGIVLSALYFRIDLFLIDLWQGTGAVAAYNAVFRLVEAMRLLPAAVVAVALPTLFRASSRRPMVQTSSLVTLSGVVVTAVVWMCAGWLIPLVYGAAYAGAVPAFRILLLSFPLMSLNYVLTHQLIGWHGQRAYAVLCLVALIFNVAVNARLIPAMGIAGAAWATVWTEAVVTIGCVARLAGRLTIVNPASSVNLATPVEPVVL